MSFRSDSGEIPQIFQPAKPSPGNLAGALVHFSGQMAHFCLATGISP